MVLRSNRHLQRAAHTHIHTHFCSAVENLQLPFLIALQSTKFFLSIDLHTFSPLAIMIASSNFSRRASLFYILCAAKLVSCKIVLRQKFRKFSQITFRPLIGAFSFTSFYTTFIHFLLLLSILLVLQLLLLRFFSQRRR